MIARDGTWPQFAEISTADLRRIVEFVETRKLSPRAAEDLRRWMDGDPTLIVTGTIDDMIAHLRSHSLPKVV